MYSDPIDMIIKGERLVNTPNIRDLVEQAIAWNGAKDRLGYDACIRAAKIESGRFCYTCGGNGEVPGVSDRPDETDACPDCNMDNGEVPY